MNNDPETRDQDLGESDGDGHLVTGGEYHYPPGIGPETGPAGAEAVPGGPPESAAGEPAGRRPVGDGADTNGQAGTAAGAHRADAPPGDGGSKRGKKSTRGRHRSWWVELPILFVFALILALLIKTFVVQAFFIPSSSMENTLKIGDKVLVNKLVYDFRPIARGDIIVFNGDGSWNQIPARPKPPLTRLWDSVMGLFGTPPGVHDYIKRVIGIPGDHVVCCNAHKEITVNGVALHEKSYLYPGNLPSAQKFSITVPPGRLWVMGDHRAISFDSRGHMAYPGHGTIPENKVVGRAFMIIAPFSRWQILNIPSTFGQPKLVNSAAAPSPGPAALPLPASLASMTPVLPGALAPATPLAFGLVGAVPLTLLERRGRRRLSALLRRRRGARRSRRPWPGPWRQRSG